MEVNHGFPSQLMLGFHADYLSGDIKPDGVEIDKADWFHYEDLPQVLQERSLFQVCL